MSNIQPNLVAYAALLLWPLLALYLYARLPLVQATIWTILGGYLLLPPGVEIKFEMIPVLNKSTVPNLAALLGCAIYARRLPTFFRGFGIAEALIVTMLVGPFITSVLNTDPIRVGNLEIPGVGPYDGGSASLAQFIFILSFFLGREFLRASDANVQILRIMVIATLAYSILMLIEVRMSPQLSNWIYGYSFRSIAVAARFGGFRPVVFLTGLWLAFFTATAVVAATALWRARIRVGPLPLGGIFAYLSFMLVLCRTLGALVYGMILIPLVRWASPRLQLRVACVLALLAISYPLLRTVQWVPTNAILQAAESVSTERAKSLRVRFTWEERLRQHAVERPWFGWGRFGRGRVVDAEIVKDISVTDGYWIITMGSFGLVGFLAQFGLLGLPVYRAATALRFVQSRRESLCLAALALIVAINMIDLLPNSSMSPWTWLLAGALLGRAEALRAFARQRMPVRNPAMLQAEAPSR